MISNSYVELPEGMRFPSTQKTAPEYGTKIGIIKISLGFISYCFVSLYITSGWWFGTCFIFHILGNSSSQLLLIFSEGLKPPTRIWSCDIAFEHGPFSSITTVVKHCDFISQGTKIPETTTENQHGLLG